VSATEATVAPLVGVTELAALTDAPDVAIVDCRFDLKDPEAGRAAFLAAHVPGAVHADLDHDLSGPPTTDRGRHPLPPPERLRTVFGQLGIDAGVRVVAYDDTFGMVAARLWWMLRYLGHEAVSVLDGGWQAWLAAGLPVASGAASRAPRRFRGEPRRDRLVVIGDVAHARTLVDARDPARYRGEHEPLDPRAGHIPGALNHCWQLNIGADGRFLDRAGLRRRFVSSLGLLPDAGTVHYCGSGVSACHNLLAQTVAGLPEGRLYCGSWSEWSRDGGREVAIGGESRE
jgi:thiosulfate/3-mercaptopyruvate sulfurtransferase